MASPWSPLRVVLMAAAMALAVGASDGVDDEVCQAGQDCQGNDTSAGWFQEFKNMEYEMSNQAHAVADEEVEVGGMTLKVSNTVFHPGIFDLRAIYPDIYAVIDVSELCRGGGKFLDLGTGMGYFALQAAKDGCTVTATDINPKAVKDAKANAERLGLGDRVTCLESDVYSALEGSGEKFDAIWWHWPYGKALPGDKEKYDARQFDNLLDLDYRLLSRFLGEGRHYLKPGGKLMVAHGEQIGDRPLFNKRLAESGASAQMVKTLVDPVEIVPGVLFTTDMFEVRYPA